SPSSSKLQETQSNVNLDKITEALNSLKKNLSEVETKLNKKISDLQNELNNAKNQIQTLQRDNDNAALWRQSNETRDKLNVHEKTHDTKYEQGDTGAKGDKGDKGDTGGKGDTGNKGDKGDTGDKGDKGDKGATGATGAVGPQGPSGAGNLTQCVVKFDQSDGTAIGDKKQDIEVIEETGKKILHYSCSSNNADIVQRGHRFHDHKNKYSCLCLGKGSYTYPSSTPSKPDKMYCYITYTECPLIS
ncbi:Collagen alpha-1(VII) chain, partial [Exaiptasia diaphana]